MEQGRAILHVDMDAFFARIEQLDRPQLRGKPVLVGSDAPRGVVSTASYEARPFGCHSAQPMAVAKRLCPHAVVVPVRSTRYGEVSEKVFAIFDDFTPVVEPLSIDEAFLDVTGSRSLLGDAVTIARRLKLRIERDLGLTASVGVTFNKFLAKLASELDKPDGITVVTRDNLDRILLPLPVNRLWGVGPAMDRKLERLGVRTVADLRGLTHNQLRRPFGSAADHYARLARGIDNRPVVPDHRAKSIGQEQTFAADLADADPVRAVLRGQADQVARRLRKQQLSSRGVTIKIRFGEFQTITRSATLERPTDITDELWRASALLFDRWSARQFRPVRLIGMHADRLEPGPGQLDLFIDPRRRRNQQLDQVMDRITDRFGKDAIRRGEVTG